MPRLALIQHVKPLSYISSENLIAFCCVIRVSCSLFQVTTGRDGHIMDAYHVQSLNPVVVSPDEIRQRLQNILEMSPLPQGIQSFGDLSRLPEDAIMMPLDAQMPLEFEEILEDFN